MFSGSVGDVTKYVTFRGHDLRVRRVSRQGRGGARYEIALLSLPAPAQAAYLLDHPEVAQANPTAYATPSAPVPPGAEGTPPSIYRGGVETPSFPLPEPGLHPQAPAMPSGGLVTPRRDTLPRRTTAAEWDRYERLSTAQKTKTAKRVTICAEIAAVVRGGVPKRAAIQAAAERAGVPAETLRGWYYQALQIDRADWLAALAPQHKGRVARTLCTPAAWSFFKAAYLQREQATFKETYRRCLEVASVEGWAVPPERTLLRRLHTDVNPLVVGYQRYGAEWLSAHLPQAHVTKGHLAAGEANSGDGLRFDTMWVRFHDGEVQSPVAWIYQDVATNRILAHAVDKNENTDLFRVATYKLLEVCLPRLLQIDNTRTAANKTMTGQAPFRHRFKNNAETDPLGLLVLAGIEVQWSNPDTAVASPGAKPIERAFGRGGLHELMRGRPQFIDRGYSVATAIDLDEFTAALDEEIARFNARRGRRTEACQGKLSFDEAWDELVRARGLRVAHASLRDLFLLRSEVATVNRKTGVLSLKAGAGPKGHRNRYWAEALCWYTGEKVTVFYHPEDLTQDVTVTTMDGKVICRAQSLFNVAFGNMADAREWHKQKVRKVKAVKKAAAAQVRMEALEVQAGIRPSPKRRPAAPAVVEARFGGQVRVVGGNLVDTDTGEVLDEECEQIRQRGEDRLLAAHDADRRDRAREEEERRRATEFWVNHGAPAIADVP